MAPVEVDPSVSAEDIPEWRTRLQLIDPMLVELGWVKNKDWFNEEEYPGMPNTKGVGYVDYVLNGSDGRPIALIEAKRTTVDIAVGRQQAKLYADLIEQAKGRRPFIFLTNGYEFHLNDDGNGYPERAVSGLFSKDDLERMYRLEKNRDPVLSNAIIDSGITNRYYQKAAINAVCTSFQEKHRKALLVMATGSGKTRTTISLCKVLLEKGWINRILFLADRLALVDQAADSFAEHLPNMPRSNLTVGEKDHNARIIFSTYETMMNCIDRTRTSDGKRIYTNGHFDLIITDEAHRSIYNKYGAIFDYFDSLLLGLTATPKDDIDKNTYSVFCLPNNNPTYAYELNQAVKDGYLVDYRSVETTVKFLDEGIAYADLSDEDKEQYENEFLDLEGNLPEKVDSSQLNQWVFNKDTIRIVIQDLMNKGRKVEFGQKLGKTIIFARTHVHAQLICDLFGELYPNHAGECVLIDNQTKYSHSLIKEFKNEQKIRIAVSVDMLDTGIDVPEILNLVFFKKVYSKCKFWQMIGRGTRLCNGLVDGRDKEDFLIFDYCSNFNFFRVNPKGKEVPTVETIQGKIFQRRLQLIGILGNLCYTEYADLRRELVDDVVRKIGELNKELFSVRMHLRCVEKYSRIESFDSISEEDVLYISSEVANLIEPYNDEVGVLLFDFLMHTIELNSLQMKEKKWTYRMVRERVNPLTLKGAIPQVVAKKDLIYKVLEPGYLEGCDLGGLENVRKELRDLMTFVDRGTRLKHYVDFQDTCMKSEEHDSELDDSDDLSSYREKAEALIRRHKDVGAVKKLYTNEPLDSEDIKELQDILWGEAGSEEEYHNEYQSKHLGVLVREILGLDMQYAKEAFSEFLSENNLNPEQTNFVNHVIEYVVQNGVISDLSVFQSAPFNENGSIIKIFDGQMNKFSGIRKIIDSINHNAETS